MEVKLVADIASFAAPSDRYIDVARRSGGIADRPEAKLMVGGFYFATDDGDNGKVYQSNGSEWLVRENLDDNDVAGQMSGLEADRAPAAKSIGWTYHATDTDATFEAFPSKDGEGAWFTLTPPKKETQESDQYARAKLRSQLSGQFGIRLESTGARQNSALTRIIFQTLDASPENPYLVNFEQHILTPFTGTDVAATGTLTSDNTNVANNDTVTVGNKVYTFKTTLTPTEGEVLRGGSADASLLNLIRAINHTGTPNTDYKCAAANPNVIAASSVTAHAFQVTAIVPGVSTMATTETSAHLSWGAVTLVGGSSAGQFNLVEHDMSDVATFDGEGNQLPFESEETIATKSGFTDGITTGAHSHFEKPITSDKVYSVVFVPGNTGDGIFSISVRALYPFLGEGQ